MWGLYGHMMPLGQVKSHALVIVNDKKKIADTIDI